MYIPTAFHNTDLFALHKLIRENSFAVLTTPDRDTVAATHLPFLLDANSGSKGTLRAHMARVNPHWQLFSRTSESLVLFRGPHCYISPSWYEHPASVPTWNYCAVHASGPVKLVDDPSQARTLLEKLVDNHESNMPAPWGLEQIGDKLDRLLQEIVAFELTITRLEGIFKLSQNRSIRDREGVVKVLNLSDDPEKRTIAGLMKTWIQN